MQTLSRKTDIAPVQRLYRNRPTPQTENSLSTDYGDVVYLVEEDSFVREEITERLSTLEVQVIAFSSANEYLDFVGSDTAACVILNHRLPDLSGLELQRRLAARSDTPVIFIADQCDVPSTVIAMKAGAIDFFTSPFDFSSLIAAVIKAFVQDRRTRQRKAELAKLKERFSLLTPREREVLPLVVGGLLNKQAAHLLGISEVTLQIHRSQVTRKMQADSFADLVRMAVKLRIPYWRESPPEPDNQQHSSIFCLGNVPQPIVPHAAR